MNAEKTAKRVLTGAAAIAAAITVHVNDEHNEVDKVAVLGVPVFMRDERGNPLVLGMRFPRWIRGPRA